MKVEDIILTFYGAPKEMNSVLIVAGLRDAGNSLGTKLSPVGYFVGGTLTMRLDLTRSGQYFFSMRDKPPAGKGQIGFGQREGQNRRPGHPHA